MVHPIKQIRLQDSQQANLRVKKSDGETLSPILVLQTDVIALPFVESRVRPSLSDSFTLNRNQALLAKHLAWPHVVYGIRTP